MARGPDRRQGLRRGPARAGRRPASPRFSSATGRAPGLAVVLVGEDPASAGLCPRQGQGDARGGDGELRAPAATPTTARTELLALIERLNADEAVDGILVQLPLPRADRRAGGASPRSIPTRTWTASTSSMPGGSRSARTGLVPCTPLGCLMLLKDRLGDLSGLEAVVIGRSNIVGKPMAQLLLARELHRHRRAQPDPRPARRRPPRRHRRRRGRPARDGEGRLAEARRHGDRRRHQPDRRGEDGRRSWSATSTSPPPARSPARSPRCRAGSGR